EKASLRLELDGERLADPSERSFGLGEIAALPPDLGEEEPCAIAHARIAVLGEHALENISGLPMLTVGQVQPAEQQLRFGRMRGHLVSLDRGEQPHERVEVILLIEMEQHFAVREIAHRAAGMPLVGTLAA